MLELTLRLVVSLAVVVGLLLLLARLGARKFRGSSDALVHVVHRQPLSRTSAVAVVTVGSRVLVLGTTEQQVSVLAELEPDELELDLDEALDGTEPLEAPRLIRSVDAADLALVRTAAASSHAASSHTASSHAASSHAASHAKPRRAARASGSHRAAPTTKQPTSVPQADGPLAGSVPSPQTWRQAFHVAARSSRGPARRAS